MFPSPDFMSSIAHAAKSGRLAHAYLLVSGRPGELEQDLLGVARLLLCSNPDWDSSRGCGGCEHCLKVAKGVHPDVTWIRPDGEYVKIESVKEFKAQIVFPPLAAARRIVIIPSAHRLNIESANAMLKVLEEPPEYAVFLLGAPQGAALLPTIRSRCHQLHSRRHDDAALAEALGGEADRLLLQLAHGDTERLRRYSTKPYQELKELFFHCLSVSDGAQALCSALELAETVASDNDLFLYFLHLAATLTKDVLVSKSDPSSAPSLPLSTYLDLQAMAHRMSLDQLAEFANWLLEIPSLMDRNVNRQYLAEKIILFWLP